MKTIRFFSFALLPALILMLSSCSKDDNEISQSPQQVDKTALNITDNPAALDELIEPILTDPGLEQELAIVNDGLPDQLDEEFSGEFQCIGRKKIRTGRLFDTLDLTSEQKTKMIWAMRQHHKCVYLLQKKMRKLNKEIILKSNAKRDALLKKYKNGDITLNELKASLAKLKFETQKLMKNNPVRKKIIEALKKCHKEYMENVRLILTKDQWNLWIKFHKQFYKHKGGKNDK